jgi:hypothetical protein
MPIEHSVALKTGVSFAGWDAPVWAIPAGFG